MITRGELLGVKELVKNLQDYNRKFLIETKRVININSFLLKTHVAQDYFSQGTRGSASLTDKLQSRTGMMKKALQVIPARMEKDSILSGISFGTRYAKVHVGPAGQSMTIRPKNAKYLAVPLPAAQGNYGQFMQSPREFIQNWPGNVNVHKSKAGNLIIWGLLDDFYSVKRKHEPTKGKMARIAGKSLGGAREEVPLFLLRKSVTVKTRIHPKDLIAWIAPKIIQNIKEIQIKPTREAPERMGG